MSPTYTDECVRLVKTWEGLLDGDPSTPGLEPYVCPAGYWTIGFGHLLYDKTGRKLSGNYSVWKRLYRAGVRNIHIEMGGDALLAFDQYPHGITPAEADELLREDMDKALSRVLRILKKTETKQGELDAFVSFAFNLGGGNLSTSTLMTCHKEGLRRPSLTTRDEAFRRAAIKDIPNNAPDQFMRWVWARQNGEYRCLNGLVKRRWEEREMYLSSIAGSTVVGP